MGRQKRNNFVKVELVLMGQEVKTIPVEPGTTLSEVADIAGFDLSKGEIQINGKKTTDFHMQIRKNCSIVAVPSVKGA